MKLKSYMKILGRYCALLMLLLAVVPSVGAYDYQWALYDVDGGDFSEGLAPSRPGNEKYYGYITTDGSMAIKPQFKYAGEFRRGWAIVSDSLGRQGIINRWGQYTLAPGNYRIDDTGKGFFKLKDKDSELCALWDGNSFLCPFEYKYISYSDSYPFASLITPDSQKSVINLLTKEIYPDCDVREYGRIGYLVRNEKTYAFKMFSYDGEPLDTDRLMLSPNGNEFFYDKETNRYGIRNAASGKVVASPKYIIYHTQQYMRLWDGEVALLADSVSPDNRYEYVLVNQDGKELLRGGKDIYLFPCRNYINIFDSNDFDRKVYYDYNGKEITQMSGRYWERKAPGVFVGGADAVFFSETGKLKTGMTYPYYSEGIVRYYDKSKDKYGYYNVLTDKTYGPYDYAETFNEGIGVAEKDGRIVFVDKTGKNYYLPEHVRIRNGSVFDSYFKEGVIPAYDKNHYTYGYIYNPLGHAGYNYSQKGDVVNYDIWNRFFEEGQTLFGKKKYAQAMDKYYQCMSINPQNPLAFNNYTVCLYNLGRYDEALAASDLTLDYWPENEFALNLRPDIISAIEERENEQSYEPETSASYSVWDALGNFANSLAMAAGTYTSATAYNSYNYGGYSSSASSGGNSSSGSDFQSQYAQWERRAESCYNSLTNLGYSVTSSSGDKSGGTGRKVSSGNYLQQKRSLREAQSNMRSIRQKAAREGISIPQSKWETAKVDY